MIICYTVPEIWHVKDVIIFHFRHFFCPFTPLTTQKIKISKKRKNGLEISSFNTSVPWIMIICCNVPEIWCVTDVIYFHFGQFFALFTPLPPSPLTAQKIKISKKRKNAWRFHHSTQIYQKSWSCAILYLRYGAWQM